MYDINKIRRDYKDSPRKLELIEIIHKQLVQQHFRDKMIITVPKKDFSSKLIKEVLSILGYNYPYKKIWDDEIPIIKKKD